MVKYLITNLLIFVLLGALSLVAPFLVNSILLIIGWYIIINIVMFACTGGYIGSSGPVSHTISDRVIVVCIFGIIGWVLVKYAPLFKMEQLYPFAYGICIIYLSIKLYKYARRERYRYNLSNAFHFFTSLYVYLLFVGGACFIGGYYYEPVSGIGPTLIGAGAALFLLRTVFTYVKNIKYIR